MLFSTAPTDGPTPNATRMTDTTVEVSWKPLTLEMARGFVTIYSIMAVPITTTDTRQRQATQPMTVTMTTDPSDSNMVTLDGLEPDLRYSVTVSASTSAGMGPPGDEVVVDILGKLMCL